MKQDELADAAYLTQSQVSNIEGARLNFRIDVLQRMAGALGARLAELVDEITPKPPRAPRPTNRKAK